MFFLYTYFYELSPSHTYNTKKSIFSCLATSHRDIYMPILNGRSIQTCWLFLDTPQVSAINLLPQYGISVQYVTQCYQSSIRSVAWTNEHLWCVFDNRGHETVLLVMLVLAFFWDASVMGCKFSYKIYLSVVLLHVGQFFSFCG